MIAAHGFGLTGLGGFGFTNAAQNGTVLVVVDPLASLVVLKRDLKYSAQGFGFCAGGGGGT